MKKLMFVAAIAASFASFGAADNFTAEDGIYNITLTQKSLDITYKYVDGDSSPIEGTGETKKDALADAQAQFDLIKENESVDAKKGKVSYKKDGESWTCSLEYTVPGTEAEKATVVTKKADGLLIKGAATVKDFYGEDYVADGTIYFWSKDKAAMTSITVTNEVTGGACIKYSGYAAYSYTTEEFPDDAVVAGSPLANKATGMIQVQVRDADKNLIATVTGAAIGTAVKDTNKGSETYGDYIAVSQLSGEIVSTVEEFDPGVMGYGTWQIKKDATLTKLANKGYTLPMLLNKKGAVEMDLPIAE